MNLVEWGISIGVMSRVVPSTLSLVGSGQGIGLIVAATHICNPTQRHK